MPGATGNPQLHKTNQSRKKNMANPQDTLPVMLSKDMMAVPY